MDQSTAVPCFWQNQCIFGAAQSVGVVLQSESSPDQGTVWVVGSAP